MTVSVALIVRNEEGTLARCLESLRDGVDEIVIVDTGSDDATKAIARRYTQRVFDFVWCEDFAAARQFAFDQATGEWVMWVDADDIILHADRIRTLAQTAPDDVGGFYWRYVLDRDAWGNVRSEAWRERLVRNDGAFHWAGQVHEVLVAREQRTIVQSADVVVEHHPEPGNPSEPTGRNLEILQAEYNASEGMPPPRLLFYLGREYADAGDYSHAIEMLEQYLRVARWDDERYIAQNQVADLHRARADYAQAIDANLRALKIHPHWPDAYFGLAKTYYFIEDWPKVVHWTDVARTMPTPDTMLFTYPMEYRYNWIIFYTNALHHVGRTQDALKWTRHALEICPDDAWHRQNFTFFSRAVYEHGRHR